MTSIEKLLVQGIRSFDPKEASVIDFYSPLTLIVGQNGAGKTTIIECLKYTCTGEMPPNCSSGQAFIHDTKIAGESEVKAQIKLRFKNPIGKPIVASRSLSLVQKTKNKQEYKQIDASLQSYTSDGQKVSKSFRCSDMDKEIPDLMGVAKPILKHVIFCHQEDSNWPLSESSKLKLKFDEIFSSVKYTKALKSLRDKKKDLTTIIKEYKLRLETVSANIEHCNRIKKELTKSQDQLTAGNKSLEEIKISIIEKQKSLSNIKLAESKLFELKNEISILNARKLEMERVKSQLFNSLTEEIPIETSNDELLYMQTEFGTECETYTALEKELIQNSEKLLNEKEILNLKLKENSNDCIRLQSIISQQDSILADRDKQMSDLVSRYKMAEFLQLSIPYEKETVQKFIIEITKKFEQLSNSINNFSKSNKQKVSSFQVKINHKKVEIQQSQTSSSQKENLIKTNQKKIESIENDITQHTLSIDRIDLLELEINKLELELAELQTLDSSRIQQELDNLINQKLEIEVNLNKLNQSLKILNLQAGSRTRLNIKRNDIKQKQNQIQLKFKSIDNSIISQINLLFNIESLDQLLTLDSNLNQLSNNQISLNTNLLNKSREDFRALTIKKNQIDAQLTSSIEPQLAKKQQELKKYQSSIKSMIGLLGSSNSGEDSINGEAFNTIESFEELFNIVKLKLEKSEKSFIVLESEDILYKEYIKNANQDKECSLCKNEMNGNDLESFVHTLESHCNDIPNQLKQLKKDIELLKSKIDIFNKIKPMIVNRQEIENILIPELLQKQISLKKQQLESATLVSDHQKQLDQLEEKSKQLQQISILFQFIVEIQKSIKSIENEIELEEQEIKKQSSDLRTIEEVDRETELYQQRLKNLNSEIKDKQDKQKKDQLILYDKQSKLITLKNELTTIKSASGIIDHLRDNKKELQSSILTSQDEIQNFQQLITTATLEAQQLESELQKLESDVEKRMETYSKEKNTFSVRLDAINQLQSKIIDSSNLNLQLEQIEIENQELDIQLQTITQDYLNGQNHIQEIQKTLSNKDQFKRNIADNITYRQQQLNIEQIIKQVNRKNELVKEMVQSQLEIDSNKLEQQLNLLKSKFDQITGQTGILQSQIKSSTLELSKPNYKNIEEVYKELLIKLQTTETVCKDLEKYYKALDKSLMKYHTLKMDEINRSIKEIWQTTYKGNDIDTIEIRSEESGTANKTLNYRVIMLKGDVELDMRGRCSAGQKVLACLVIRLALAENFCTNCGILALDEPTSHLDRANIESFANSLLNIVESRRAQKGFQLIIITHDEEFVQYLSRGNYCDYYWRVTKNANQHSQIERKEIADL